MPQQFELEVPDFYNNETAIESNSMGSLVVLEASSDHSDSSQEVVEEVVKVEENEESKAEA